MSADDRTTLAALITKSVFYPATPEDWLPDVIEQHAIDAGLRAADAILAAGWRAPDTSGTDFCSRCEITHRYCECDEFAHLGTHSAHKYQRPHRMGE
jgi:hypothetical protein